MKPKISIVTATYNSERTVEGTIKSVLAQGYDRLEYIIIDGLSTDSTLDIVRRYESQIATIGSEKDHGISDAFNKGIAHATGDVLCFINSDDVMLPGALDAIANGYDGQHDIYCGNVLLETPTTGFKCREVPSTHFPVVPLFCHVAHQGMFVTLDAYRRFGGYDTAIRWPMDLDFLMRVTRLGAHFKHIDYDIACFREGGATSANIRKKQDYLRIVRQNGGNALQAYFFYYSRSKQAQSGIIPQKISSNRDFFHETTHRNRELFRKQKGGNWRIIPKKSLEILAQINKISISFTTFHIALRYILKDKKKA